MKARKNSQQRHDQDIKDNYIQQRIGQVIEVLKSNNGALSQRLASDQRIRDIITHNYNCLDQLEFVTLEYARSPANYLHPKQLADSMGKLMGVLKAMLAALRHWLATFILYLPRGQFRSIRPANARCEDCNNNLHQIAINQARKHLLGVQYSKQLFEDQLVSVVEKEVQMEPAVLDYTASITYLTRMMREMQDQAKNYQESACNLQNNIDKNVNEDQNLVLKLIQDFVVKIRSRMGVKCRAKLKQLVESLQRKQQIKKPRLVISKQIQYIVKFQSKEKMQQSQKIRQLRNQVNFLKLESDKFHQLYLQLIQSGSYQKIELTDPQKFKGAIKRVSSRISQQLQQKKNNPSLIPQSSNKTWQEQPISKIQPKIKISRKNASIFNLRNFTESSQEPAEPSKILEQNEDNSISDYNSSRQNIAKTSDQLKKSLQYRDIGCQWEKDPSSNDNIKILKKSRKFGQIIQKWSKTKGEDSISQDIQEEEENASEIQSGQKLERDHSIIKQANFKSRKSLGYTKDNMDRQNILPRELAKGYLMNTIVEGKRKTQRQKQITLLNKISSNTLKNNEINPFVDPKQQKKGKKIQNGRSENRISKQGKTGLLARRDRPERQDNTTQSLGQSEKRKNQKGRRESSLVKVRFHTEVAEARKRQKARNRLFQVEHLNLFGGVSESYRFQLGTKAPLRLSEQQESYLDLVYKFIVSLQQFRVSFYQNILSFLVKPYQTIDKDQVQVVEISREGLKNKIRVIMSLHKKNCGNVCCEHLVRFYSLIGMPPTSPPP